MKKAATLSAALVLTFCSLHTKGEILGHISDETEPSISTPDTSQNNDRRIIYRVICTPGGEVLPDCERPFNDSEALAEPIRQQEGGLDLEEANSDDALSQTPKAAASSKKSSKKAKTSKKSSKKKKSRKKSATKNKTASNKK